MNGYSNIPDPDPYEPQFKFYDVNKPFKAEGSDMGPAAATIIAAGLTGLSNWFTGRGERKQRQKELEEQRRQFEALQAQRRREYFDEQQRRRGIARLSKPIFEALAGADIGSGPITNLAGLFSSQR